MAGETILIVEDETNVREILERMLVSAGYKPLCTGDPEEGLALAREVAPDVAVLDVMLPRMDGFDLCQMLRGHADTKDIPVIFLTALGDVVSKLRGNVSGGTAYLKKPFTKEVLLGALREAIAARASPPRKGRSGWTKAARLDGLRAHVKPSRKKRR